MPNTSPPLGSSSQFWVQLSGESWTQIVNVISIQPPQISVPMHERKFFGSSFVLKRPGVVNLGEGQITFEYDPANADHKALRDKVFAKAKLGHRIVDANGERTTYDGYFTGWPVGAYDAEGPQEITLGTAPAGDSAIVFDTAG